MDLKTAIDIIMNKHEISNETMTEEQEQAFETYNNSSEKDTNNFTEEESKKFSEGYMIFMMFSKGTGTDIKEKFSNEYDKIRDKIADLKPDKFEAELDKLMDSNKDFNLDILKDTIIDNLCMSDYVPEELRERIWHNKIKDDKKTYYLVVQLLEKITDVANASNRQKLLDLLLDLTEED